MASEIRKVAHETSTRPVFPTAGMRPAQLVAVFLGAVLACLPPGSPAVSAADHAAAAPPSTFVYASIWEPEVLDPAWTYETRGAEVQLNLYDSLVAPRREDPTAFVPALATDWRLSSDGTQYTFQIREEVSFHEGGTLEPHDVAYSLQRALLQDRVDGPMWMYLEPILGAPTIESYVYKLAGAEPPGGLADIPPEIKEQACTDVKAAVGADDTSAMVVIRLRKRTPWFLELLSKTQASILDMEWMMAEGDWDGSCSTWTAWHDPAPDDLVLLDRANGTGPYRLESWRHGLLPRIELTSNHQYWRDQPAWPGGPTGAPRLRTVEYRHVESGSEAYQALITGAADAADHWALESELEPYVHTAYHGPDESSPSELKRSDGHLKLFDGFRRPSAHALLFNFEVAPNSEFLGSGVLGTDGVPPDFFADIHVRRAFNYCFNWERFISEGLGGNGVKSRGPIIEGLPGWSVDSPVYDYDLAKCRAELAQAWGGRVAKSGFALTIAYNEGNRARESAAVILKESLASIDPRYRIDTVELEWPSYLAARSAGSLPVQVAGWLEDYHDAHNWAHSFLHRNGAYGLAQHFPAEMADEFDDLVERAATEGDALERDRLYGELQRLSQHHAVAIYLAQSTGRFYVNRAVSGWFYNPTAAGTPYYVLSKGSPLAQLIYLPRLSLRRAER